MRVKPAVPGNVVRFPTPPHRRLSDDGEEVPETGPDSLYWHRLLLTGDVVRCGSEPTGHEPVTPLTTR